MPIGADERAAAAACRAEAERWMEIAHAWDGTRHPAVWNDLPPLESAVVGYHDPASDLEHRASRWGHRLERATLGDLCRFGAGLAAAEADAWASDTPDLAVRASEDRRFLLGDRILHWAVPWLDAAGRCHPSCRDDAHAARDTLLDLGDAHRPAPDLAAGREGVYLPGEDAYGPIDPPGSLGEWLGSLWSGTVLFRATLESMTGEARAARRMSDGDMAALRGDLSVLYVVTAARWRRRAHEHPGSARLWNDLAARAGRTATLLEG